MMRGSLRRPPAAALTVMAMLAMTGSAPAVAGPHLPGGAVPQPPSFATVVQQTPSGLSATRHPETGGFRGLSQQRLNEQLDRHSRANPPLSPSPDQTSATRFDDLAQPDAGSAVMVPDAEQSTTSGRPERYTFEVTKPDFIAPSLKVLPPSAN